MNLYGTSLTLLIVLVGPALAGSRAWADDPAQLSSISSGPIIAEQFSADDPGLILPEPMGKTSGVGTWLRNHNVACWTHHNNMGCGSFMSDWKFMFGSCRTFFGEPCFSKPVSNQDWHGFEAGCPCR
jgi:hypothetical protein